MNNINDDELRFVARHYKTSSLDTRRAWHRFKKLRGTSRLGGRRKMAVAASVTLAVGIAVAAGIIGYNNYVLPQKPKPQYVVVDTTICEYEECDTADVFHFDHTPINQVLDCLSCHYHKQLSVDDTTKSVSGEIEATKVEDAIEVLETTLGVKIETK